MPVSSRIVIVIGNFIEFDIGVWELVVEVVVLLTLVFSTAAGYL